MFLQYLEEEDVVDTLVVVEILKNYFFSKLKKILISAFHSCCFRFDNFFMLNLTQFLRRSLLPGNECKRLFDILEMLVIITSRKSRYLMGLIKKTMLTPNLMWMG